MRRPSASVLLDGARPRAPSGSRRRSGSHRAGPARRLAGAPRGRPSWPRFRPREDRPRAPQCGDSACAASARWAPRPCAAVVSPVAFDPAAATTSWVDGPIVSRHADRRTAGGASSRCATCATSTTGVGAGVDRAAWEGRAPCAAVACWWLSIRPSNDRDWQPDVARTPTAERQGSVVTVRDVRDFDYRTETDFTERWEERRYDLDRVVGLDLFVFYWGPTLYAHTILSWDFEGSPPLAASIETRKEKGESYSAVLGFFRQFELVYVLADERDVIRLRTNFRGERVFLYRLDTSRAGARALLEQYLSEANALATAAGLVQRVHRELHDGDLAERAGPLPGQPVRLAAPRERLRRPHAVRAGPRGHEPALRRAAAAERHHGAREGLRLPGRLLPLHPGGPAHARGAAAVDCWVGRPRRGAEGRDVGMRATWAGVGRRRCWASSWRRQRPGARRRVERAWT